MVKKSNTHNKEITRVDMNFKNMLKDIKFDRYKNGKDQEPISHKRLTLAITRIPNIRKTLTEAEIIDDLQ